jgi:hypothetical protein
MIAFFAILSGAKAWIDIEKYGIIKEKWLRRLDDSVSASAPLFTF